MNCGKIMCDKIRENAILDISGFEVLLYYKTIM